MDTLNDNGKDDIEEIITGKDDIEEIIADPQKEIPSKAILDLKTDEDAIVMPVDAIVMPVPESQEWSLEIEPNEDATSKDILNPETSNTTFIIQHEAPSYKSDFTGFLTEKEFSLETGKHIPNDAALKKVCFNCLGNHNVGDCKEKKNYKTIAENKQAFLSKRSNGRMKNVRYHEEEETLHDHFKPGTISDSLRDVLGMRANDTPEFVYRMRMLGYPPGWLKDAEVQRSDVSLIDGAGVVIDHPEDEEGETDVNRVKYEPDKLISFAGFNSPLPPKHCDDHHYYDMPVMQPHHRKEEFEKFMNLNKARKYKKKKLKRLNLPVSAASLEVSEMEIDNVGISSVIEVNPIPVSAVTAVLESKEEGECSEDSSESFKVVTEKSRSPITEDSFPNSLPDATNGGLFSTPIAMTRKRHHRSRSKGCSLGIYIPDSITPHKDLPTPEKWGADVSDHILFENLPDALGTWNKMKGIVRKVKVRLSELHAEDDDD